MCGGGECSRQEERPVGAQRHADARADDLRESRGWSVLQEIAEVFDITGGEVGSFVRFAIRSLNKTQL